MALIKNERPYRKGKTWATDGFYHETRDMILYRKDEGYSMVEIECASMAVYSMILSFDAALEV